MEKSRADNSGQNGFQFQAAAAISLLLDYLYDFSKIKNEHELEDIVIILSDGSFILSQSKSSHDNEKSSNALKYIKQSLETLHKASINEPNHKLIYITNIREMLGRSTVVDDFVCGETVWFSDFDKQNVELIKKYAPANFDYNSFGIQFLKYHGDEDKEKWIIDKMKQTFSNSKNLKNLTYKKVYNTWVLYLLQNASKKDTHTYCDKETMIWGMVVHRIDEVDEEISNESDIDYSEISNMYDTLIKSLAGRFQTVSRIYGDYQNIKRKDSSIVSPSSFSTKYWESYADLVQNEECESRIKKKIIQNLIETIIRRQDLLLGVREEFRL